MKDQQTAGDADGKAEDIQGGIAFSFEEAAPGEPEMIFQHMRMSY
jgi:hypothetical protein